MQNLKTGLLVVTAATAAVVAGCDHSSEPATSIDLRTNSLTVSHITRLGRDKTNITYGCKSSEFPHMVRIVSPRVVEFKTLQFSRTLNAAYESTGWFSSSIDEDRRFTLSLVYDKNSVEKGCGGTMVTALEATLVKGKE